jgi:polyisoprenoid-binding protein YceI
MAAVRFTFDAERSCVWVDGRWSLRPINTETRGIQGWVEVAARPDGTLDLSGPVTGTLEVTVDRLSSGNQLYDRELKRRIDARNHPVIVGQITQVRSTDEPSTYLVTGDLSFHGRTRTFEHEMAIEVVNGTDISLKGAHVFDLRDFNMKPPSMLMLKVYPEVSVRVELHGHHSP